ncbi:MAG: MBL fold metallo-hydrolase [Eubacteriales bacterium]|nr:MBL fold metallo-hydrolase [Eubacteriales bacterium]MDD4122561.1 MBL fold metallo-hydrolase [Eubacteriales bacterium]MDD4630051.1 MBL fold metallo-hydrolase [Eubacteriales bacterium]
MINDDRFNSIKRFQFTNVTDKLVRVTAGAGGESILIKGSEKTALIDCGMACFGNKLVDNVKKELGDRMLDYVILSHTHYDHIGALPYIRKAWPDLISFGAVYGKKVLKKKSALRRIEDMSESAWVYYLNLESKPLVLMDGMRIDQAVSENDVISLGEETLTVFETPGHTACSLTYLLNPYQILFTSESTGVYIGKGQIITGLLKSYRETVKSIEKCRRIKLKHIISPHYGLIPEDEVKSYWDYAEASSEQHKYFVLEKIKSGESLGEIMEEYKKEFWGNLIAEVQPKEAFLENAYHMIKNLKREFTV